jgi:glycosyltransferase involved in cell wall biosynthesis
MRNIGGADIDAVVLPMPVDTAVFGSDDAAVVPGRIGFSGRIDDPRKNIGLMFRAVSELIRRGADVSLVLIGGDPDAREASMVDDLEIGDRVTFLPYLSKTELAQWLKTIDVFVVPSHQEGLCISALEAMASGCPVVSTRCGGPEEYVIEDQTGYLTGFDPVGLANAVEGVVKDRAKRARLSDSAQAMVTRRYNRDAASQVFWAEFDRTFATDEKMVSPGDWVRQRTSTEHSNVG